MRSGIDEPWGEDVVCIFCDYGLVILAVFIVIIIGFFRWRSPGSNASPLERPVTPSSEPHPFVNSSTATMIPPQINPSPVADILEQTITPEIIETSPSLIVTVTFESAEKPEYVMVFVPVAWTGDRASFERAAKMQGDLFIDSADIRYYFEPVIILLDEEIIEADLTDYSLLDEVIKFGIKHKAGDRYIGITDQDLRPEGEDWVSGWAYGFDTLGAMVESGDASILGHELGHTFGLCDEYNFDYWVEQNEEYPSGCPNPYPERCSVVPRNLELCLGNPTPDGRNSMMGPSGIPGPYGYNEDSLDHLHEIFREIGEQALNR